jgi:hypothetical protein
VSAFAGCFHLAGLTEMDFTGWFYLSLWIALSCSMIVMNKAILSQWNFSFPFFLTAWHMFFASITTQVLARTTSMLQSHNEGKINLRSFVGKILPIACLFAASLMLGNKAYIFLSVSYIQMLKAATPVVVLFISISIGNERASSLQLAIVFLISFGVCLSSAGELRFSVVGFACQLGGESLLEIPFACPFL